MYQAWTNFPSTACVLLLHLVLLVSLFAAVKDECKETGGPLCLNGGECLDSYNAFYCQCNGSYGGHRCGEARKCAHSCS